MMSVTLTIDQREKELKEHFEGGSNVELKNLDVGDICFTCGEETLLVIERKTTKDLAASIRDGRHREQKARLMGCGLTKDRLMYLIEGRLNQDPSEKVANISVDTLLSSVVNTQFRDGIRVYKTSSVKETIHFLEKLHCKFEKERDKFWKYSDDSEVFSASQYCGSLKTKKKENMTPEVWYISLLSMIPQVTVKIASVIATEYKTLETLIDSFYDEDEGGKHMIQDLTYETESGKTRRIGPKASERIFEYLCRSRAAV